MPWRPFSFDVESVTLDDQAGGDSGVVYSTSPRKAIGKDSETHFVKGLKQKWSSQNLQVVHWQTPRGDRTDISPREVRSDESGFCEAISSV